MADHWRTPHTTKHSLAIACGAMVGPVLAILFVLAVIWLAGFVPAHAMHFEVRTVPKCCGNLVPWPGGQMLVGKWPRAHRRCCQWRCG